MVTMRPKSKRAVTVSNMEFEASKNDSKSQETVKFGRHQLTRSNSVHVFSEYGVDSRNVSRKNTKRKEQAYGQLPNFGDNGVLDSQKQQKQNQNQNQNQQLRVASGDSAAGVNQKSLENNFSIDVQKTSTRKKLRRPNQGEVSRVSSARESLHAKEDLLMATSSHPSFDQSSAPRSYKQTTEQIIIPTTSDHDNLHLKEEPQNESSSTPVLIPFNTNNNFDQDLQFTDELLKTGGKRDGTVIYRKKDQLGGGVGSGGSGGGGGGGYAPMNELKATNGHDLIDDKLISGGVDLGNFADEFHEKQLDASPQLPKFDKGTDIYDTSHHSPSPSQPPSDADADRDSQKSHGSAAIWRRRWSKLCCKKSFLIIIGVLLSAFLLLLGGCIPVMYLLSKGTQDSVDKYFSDPRHKPYLDELYQKYIVKVAGEIFGPHSNTVEGLSPELKNDNEVVELMSVVSNVLFNGIAYSPSGTMEPICGFSRRDAMLDLAKLSTVTTKIRTYGMQCNQSELILDAIDHMNLNMTVALGVWISSNETENKSQMDLMKKLISAHPDPQRVINSIYIGNEVLFRGDVSKEQLLEYIQDAKSFLKLIHAEAIPVGTSEVGSLIDSTLLAQCDVVGANIHPFFGGVGVEDATSWTLQFLNYQIQPENENHSTQIVLTELGWPSGGGRHKRAIASEMNMKYFIRDFLCTLKTLPVDYYFFEAFDEPWKEIYWEGNQKWETEWGIFNSDRSNKFPLQYMGCM
ncbi:uncharacterized protein LODBEIA_P51860 [Lodderomyces beijingensis]|uniref:glucan endo-1,3-beta-D-glucosidase n=1 Tax=Lodderomyces beijingensis TaxID=1775926 RepID=A0ABP0ZS70_9ASCO